MSLATPELHNIIDFKLSRAEVSKLYKYSRFDDHIASVVTA